MSFTSKEKPMANYIRTLTVIYDINITDKEIPLFRGAVINSLGDKANLLFHNHKEDNTYRYSYPLIQYKRVNNKAAITCVEEGVDLVGQILSELSGTIVLGERKTEYHVDEIHSTKEPIQIKETFSVYQLHQWLPLNSINYAKYQDTEELVEKIRILERVLTGNILSFLKGIDIYLKEQLIIHITDIFDQKAISYKHIKLLAFDIKFKANINLPPYISVGKNASIGNGTLTII